MCISIFLTIYTYMCIYRYAYTSIYIYFQNILIMWCPALEGVFCNHGPTFTPSPFDDLLGSLRNCPSTIDPAARHSHHLRTKGLSLAWSCVTCPQSSGIKSVALGKKNNMIWKVPTHLFVLSNQSVINKLVMARERLPQLGSFCILPHHHFSGFSIQSLAFWWCWKDLKGIKVCAAKSSKGLQYL